MNIVEHQGSNFSAILWWEQVTFWLNDDDVHFFIRPTQLVIDTTTTKTGEYNHKLEEIRKKQDLDHRKRKLLESCLDVNSRKKGRMVYNQRHPTN